jgi:hypothetical protein
VLLAVVLRAGEVAAGEDGVVPAAVAAEPPRLRLDPWLGHPMVIPISVDFGIFLSVPAHPELRPWCLARPPRRPVAVDVALAAAHQEVVELPEPAVRAVPAAVVLRVVAAGEPLVPAVLGAVLRAAVAVAAGIRLSIPRMA